MADPTAIAYFRRQRGATAGKDTPIGQRPSNAALSNQVTRGTNKTYAGLFPGIQPVVGTPDDVVAELRLLREAGIAGSALVFLVFLNYLSELPYFAAEVLPRMERAGLRGVVT